jgi:uncharacterized protein (DUF1697 family)
MRYVAFLRAINVGGHVVKMDVLKTTIAELDFTAVETFISSGNVFDSPSMTEGTRAKDRSPRCDSWL